MRLQRYAGARRICDDAADVELRAQPRHSGHIINIGSVAGHEVYPGGNVYCASKHAVDALTKGLRMDLVDTPLGAIRAADHVPACSTS